MKLIDRQALIDAIVNTPSEVAMFHSYNDLSSLAERQNEILNIVENAPTVDAVPVVHGRWEKSEPGYSICGHCKADVAIFSDHKNYCPNCGADMRGGAEDG